jgi:hypothetical protein
MTNNDNKLNTESLLKNVRTNLINISSSLKSRFYDNCIEHLDLSSVIENLQLSHEIKDKHIVEPFRLFYYREFEKYYFYVFDISVHDKFKISSIINHAIIHQIELKSNKVLINLLRQLDVLENNDINRLTLDIPDNLKYIKNILFVASSIDLTNEIPDVYYIPLKNKRSINLFLNNYTLTFLKHQDLNRFANYLKSTDNYVKKSVNMFKNVYNLFKQIENYDISTYERLMLFSGFVLHTLGTTYTTDADIIYNARGLSTDNIKSITNELDKSTDIEYFIYADTDHNIEYISDLITDPDKHYYFMGMKIININSHIKRLYQRASPSAFVDLIMMHKINGFKINPCIPVITIDEDEVTVYTEKMIEIKLRTTQKYFREWHGINYSISDLKVMIKRCKNYPNDPPFYKPIRTYPFTLILDSYLHYGIQDIINEYFVGNKIKLLILDDSKEYPRFYPKKNSGSSVTIIEPSDAPLTEVFIKMTDKKKHDISRSIVYNMVPIDYISKWKKQTVIELDSKYDNVFINFSLKYLMSDPDMMMTNLANVTNTDAKVLAIFIDGDVIENVLGSTNRFEIKDDDDKTIIGVYRYDNILDSKGTNIKQFVIYVKGTLRFGTGSVEYVINAEKLQNLFISNGYSIISSGSFSNKQDSYISNNTHITSDKDRDIIREVLGWFKYILFKRL